MMFMTEAVSNNEYLVKVLLTTMALFLIGSMLGYVVEVFFRRFFSVKKWVNPGFMKGPWLPMYGFGLVFMFFLLMLLYHVLPSDMALYNPSGDLFDRELKSMPTWLDLVPIFSLTAVMILLEFIAGLVFVKGFKVRLWDYTNMKGNIMGIICPVFNLIWFSVAVIYYYLINPFVYMGFSGIYLFLFGSEGDVAHFGMIFFMGLLYGIFIVDLVKSIGLFSRVEKIAQKSGIIEKYEKLREEARLSQDGAKKKFFDLLPDVIKRNLQKDRTKPSMSEKIYEEARKAVLIDPQKRGTEQNYDEKGRPIKEEDVESKQL